MVFRRRRNFRRKKRGWSRNTYRGRTVKRNRRLALGGAARRFFKVRYVSDMTTSVGGTFSTVYNDNPTAFGDWTSIATMFDSYKICALRIKFIPSLPNDTSTQTGYYPFYVCGDPDDTNILTSTGEVIEYENMKVFNLYRPFKYYYKLPIMTSDGTTAVTLQGGYRDVSATAGKRGIKTWAEDLDASQKYGTFITTAYIVAKNRR